MSGEPACTCGVDVEFVCRQLDTEPHYVGCPRWGTLMHTPTITGTGNYASSAACSCGWQSGQLYRDATAAHAIYRQHLTQTERAR